jgi:hypothetical protein
MRIMNGPQEIVSLPSSAFASHPMKTSPRLLALLLLPALVSLPAGSAWSQQREALPELKSARVVERGSHHAKWETVQEVADPISGETISVTNSYVQLETGLHYLDEGGEWQESSEEIEVQPGAAVARRGPHQVRWAANLNTYGAIEFWTPEGEAIRSHVLGLAYFDPATGAHVMIGEVQDSIGAVAGNQVIYEDAFAGVSADLHYTYTKGGFVQDVIVREKLPDPALWGFDPGTVQVQVLTEFVALPDALKELARITSEVSAATNALTGSFETAYAEDQALSFGTMSMTQGRAFGVENAAQERAVPVRKRLQLFEGGRNILVETLDYVVMEPELETLPENSKPTASLDRKSSEQQTASLRVAPVAPTRQWAAVEPPGNENKEPLLMARAELPAGRNGYVIDYNLSGTINNLTLQSDTTYHVTGLVTATGITTIEGGTIVKFANSNDPEIRFQGTLACLTAPFRPAIFTAKDDNSVGTAISGSTGAPSGYYAKNALWVDNFGSDLRHVHVRYAGRAIIYNATTAGAHQLSHVQLVNCGYGIVSVTPKFKVANALFHNVVTNFHTTTTSITGEIEHLTSNGTSVFRGSTGLTLNVTNSLLVGVTSGYSGAGNANPTTSSGLFQTVGSGQHYLAGGSTHRNAGVTDITAGLKLAFQRMTTYPPPVVLSNVTFTADTVWGPLVPRDTDIPDRGYHYTAVDYVVQGVAIEGAKLILTNGVSIAGYGTSAYLWPKEGGQLISAGTPDRMNEIGEYVGVQEQPQIWGATFFIGYTRPIYSKYTSSPGSVDLRYTRLPLIHMGYLSSGSSGFGSYNGFASFSMAHCEAYRGRIHEYNVAVPATLLNNLFHRAIIDTDAYAYSTHAWHNNTFFRGAITNKSTGATGWTIRDNLFDQTVFSFTAANPVHNNNGYSAGTTVLPGTTSGNVTLAGTPGFAVGPLGSFYLPANSTLINAGSRTAANAGLYHHTTMLSGTKEAATQVDIGYHYVAGDLMVTGPVGYWRFDEGTGTTAGDSTIPANNGSLLNGPTWVSGQQGYGLNFDGVNDRVNVPSQLIATSDSQYSYSAWFNGNGTGGGTDGRKFILETTGSGSPWVLSACINASAKLQIAIWSSGSSFPGTTTLVSGQWYHVTVTWDKNGGANNLKAYLNGVLEIQTTTSVADPVATTGLNIGTYRNADNRWFGGIIDEVRVYNRALDPGEVQRLYLLGALSEEFSFVLHDTDGDTLPDYFEDANGNGTADTGETNWQSYNSPNGLPTNPGLQVFTPLN